MPIPPTSPARTTGAELLQEAFDAHVHFAPDVVSRAQDAYAYARDAAAAGMAGAVLKDHCGSTASVAATLNTAFPRGPLFLGSLTLNPAVGGLNPSAVEAALQAGARVVWFPTYGARFQIERSGRTAMPFPMPAGFPGLSILDESGAILPEVRTILELVARHEAVVGTGHLSPTECLMLVRAAREYGVSRIVVTHASEPVPRMSIEDQRAAVAAGAVIEHCLLACTASMAAPLSYAALAAEIRAIGVAHVIVSSDFGQPLHGPPVAAFARHLGALAAEGFPGVDLDQLVRFNPRTLLCG
jgi:hypothetical protein